MTTCLMQPGAAFLSLRWKNNLSKTSPKGNYTAKKCEAIHIKKHLPD